jgi:ubiquinone/menaquinone biosynthesis C-methylase UbiE
MSTLAFLCLLVLIVLGWSIVARRQAMPCPSWLGWLVELENPIARKFHAENIIERLDLRPGMKVLDAGCGPGRLTIPLAKAVGAPGEVVAADLQDDMLRRTETRARAAGLTNITFLRLKLGEGTLGNDLFDRAVLVTVLGEIPDGRAALREIYGALKPGGILSITETIFDPHYQRRSAVLELVRAAGFIEKSLTGNLMGFTVNLERPGDSQKVRGG